MLQAQSYYNTDGAVRLSRRRFSRGAAIIELCIVSGFLIVVLFVSVQLAYFIDTTNSMSQISYQVCRYAAQTGRSNSPTVDQADQDYTDSNKSSVFYEAYQICNESTLVPYGQGSVPGSTNSFAVANAHGATITVTYTNASTGLNEPLASERSEGDYVKVDVAYNLANHMFMSTNFPVVGSMATTIHRISNMVIIN